MIDWLWMRVNCSGARHLKPGRVMSLSPDGEIEWQIDRWLQSRGSFDNTMSLRPCPEGVEISGSPAKFLQGHNIFGVDDALAMGVFVIGQVADAFALTFTDAELEQILTGDVELLRVDANESFSSGSRGNAIAWIRGASEHGTMRNRGRGIMKFETLVFGNKSRHWAMHMYCKGQELAEKKKGHALPAEVVHRDKLLAHADDLIRIELRFAARGLRERQLDRLKNWNPGTGRAMLVEHLAKLTLSGDFTMTTEELAHLPGSLRTALDSWQSGTDLRGVLSRRTFYRYRKQLLDLAGVDIAVAPVNNKNNVVPLVRTIEAIPVGIPEWARGTPLLWEPPVRRRA